jgi:hypothetical protein
VVLPAYHTRRITDPDDAAIAEFGLLQDQTYFEPEMLIPARYIRHLLAQQVPERHNMLLIVEDAAGSLVAGSLFHYFKEPNLGFSSYLGVINSARGRGLARMIHNERFVWLDEAAQTAGYDHVLGVVIDVLNPNRLSAEDIAREHQAGSDPVLRRQVFGHLGFSQLALRYEQPVGGPNGGPVTTMDLLFAPHPSQTRPQSLPMTLIERLMLAYWTPWIGLGPQGAPAAAAALAARADGLEIALVSPM